MNLGQYAVELYVDYVAIKLLWGADRPVDDEENCFVIQKFDLNERNYPKGWKITQFLKDERISEVILARDTIKTNKGELIVSDTGVVIRTDENVYSVSRIGIDLRIKESDRIEMPLSVADVTEQYTDDYCGVKPVEVRRDFLSL